MQYYQSFGQAQIPVKKRREIEKLADEIKSTAYYYYYPNSPATLFLFILQSYVRVEPGEYFVPEWTDQFLGDYEIGLLIDWLNKMWQICEYNEDFQYLYDLLVAE